MKEKEIWKFWHKTSRTLWEVSDQGNVKKNGELYECRLSKKGYKGFSNISVHRAVAELFIPNPDNKPCVDHINTIKTDNRAVNLRWVTYSENNLNEITRKHMSESKKGNQYAKGKIFGPQSEEHRRKISETQKMVQNKEETRRKKSEAMKGKNKNRHRVYHNDGTWHMEK